MGISHTVQRCHFDEQECEMNQDNNRLEYTREEEEEKIDDKSAHMLNKIFVAIFFSRLHSQFYRCTLDEYVYLNTENRETQFQNFQ